MRDWDAEFAAIAEETPQYYPGSTRAIVRHPNRTEARKDAIGLDPDWDKDPKVFETADGPTEFFTIGDLARALGRRPVTIRKWERDGVIPQAQYQIPGRDNDPRGRRRLYTRKQVEGMVRVAAEEGLFRNTTKPIAATQFAERVRRLFEGRS